VFAVDPLRERVADQSVIEIENVFERDLGKSLAVDLAESIDGRADQVVCVALLSLGPEIHGESVPCWSVTTGCVQTLSVSDCGRKFVA
jgi:hypothetical protein